MFGGINQHDAQEFSQLLMNALHLALNVGNAEIDWKFKEIIIQWQI